VFSDRFKRASGVLVENKKIRRNKND